MEYYTIKDIMDILGVSRNTAYKIANIDGMPTLRLGRTIRIEKEGFDKWRRDAVGSVVNL